MKHAITVHVPANGRKMEIYTTNCALQFYSGGFLGSDNGRNGVYYKLNGALVLETQDFPDAVNQDNFPNVILRPGEKYNHKTVLKFSAE